MTARQLTPLRILPTVVPSQTKASVEIYRPFFLAGILTVLTAGCTLGAIALVGVAFHASYTASAWTPYVLAHANSQLYGWVGFFVIGFALQQHPPLREHVKRFHQIATLILALMGAGIALRFVADPMASAYGGIWVAVGAFSAVLQFVAVVLFMVNSRLMWKKTGEQLPWQSKFMFASLAWMAIVALAEPIVFVKSHQSPMESILFVAQWMPAMREAQFLGFVANMIFGVALVKMNSCFGAKAATRELGNAAFAAWNIGVVLRMFGWVTYFRSGMDASSVWAYQFSSVVLACGAVFFVVSSHIFERTSFSLPSHKFIRAAFAWLLIGGVLQLLEPTHLRQIGAEFSHAYIGAIRHALTVGFISQMIIGVGSHVIAKMNDIPDSLQRRFMATFWLLNLGNAGRVALEIATDYTPRAFAPMGFTGFVELAGLALWATAMIRIMVASRRTSLNLQAA